MGTIGAVLTPQMPKQVWQSEDGSTFETEAECLAYEKLAPLLRDLVEGSGDQAQEALGMQPGFASTLQVGFYEAGRLMHFRKSFQRLSDVMHGRVKLD